MITSRHRKKFHFNKIAIACFFFLISVFSLAACGKSSEPYSKSGFYFDTVIQITLYDAEQESLLDDCFSMAQEYEALLSPSAEGSDLWKINHAEGKPVEIAKETHDLLEQSVSYAELTGGKIDPTTLSLSRLWGFYVENSETEGAVADNSAATDTERIPPSAAAIENCLAHVNYKKLQLSAENGKYTACLPDGEMQVDLGFIAKGYIADKMKEYLVSQGVTSGIINLGGNVLTIGGKPKTGDTNTSDVSGKSGDTNTSGTDYVIGIKPFDQNGTPITTVSVQDKSVVTSGIYERCFTYDGVSYHHILDALTGYPADNELYSVTIISDSSMQGDALSTSCMLLGLDAGMELIENTTSCEAVFITKDMEIYRTSDMQE